MSAPVFPDNFNMADYFVFSNIEAGRGEKPAILFEGQTIPYRTVADNVMRVAKKLVSYGLLPEQRVLLCMQDRPEFAYAWFGAIKAGGVVGQINPLLTAEDYTYYLNYVRPQFVFLDEQSLPEFEKALKTTRHCGRSLGQDNAIVAGPNAGGHKSFDAWLKEEPKPDAEPWPTRKDDPAVWLFTSGTTGQSKGAVHTHSHFPYNTEAYAKAFIGMRENDLTISVSRLFFGYATGTNLMFPFAVGAATALFREQPTSELLFELIEKHRPTVLTSVPTFINKMLQTPEAQRRDISSVRFMWSAGEALPRELHERWDRAFGVPIIDGIGSAESFHIYISNRPGDVRPGSLGRLVPGYEAKLVDDDGNPVAKGDVGTLWVRGDSATPLYWNRPDKTAETIREEGWIYTGDRFVRDADGFYFFRGRADDLIKISGQWVYPLEVELCLADHPEVRECAVFAAELPDRRMTLKAVVVMNRGGFDEGDAARELQDYVKAKLLPYKYPREIRFIDELPKTGTGKIDRQAVMRM